MSYEGTRLQQPIDDKVAPTCAEVDDANIALLGTQLTAQPDPALLHQEVDAMAPSGEAASDVDCDPFGPACRLDTANVDRETHIGRFSAAPSAGRYGRTGCTPDAVSPFADNGNGYGYGAGRRGIRPRSTRGPVQQETTG